MTAKACGPPVTFPFQVTVLTCIVSVSLALPVGVMGRRYGPSRSGPDLFVGVHIVTASGLASPGLLA